MLTRTISHTIRACLALGLLFALTTDATGQSAEGESRDVTFQVVDATTGRGGTVSRLTIDYVTYQANTVAEISPSDTTFTVPGVPVVTGGAYVITVWKDGVPYWWSKRGRDLEAGPVVLHVFDNAAGSEGLSVAGMDVILRHEGSLLKLQYMLQIRNDRTPQVTVFGSGPALTLALPSDATGVEAVYLRGPEPTPVDLEQGGGRLGLDFPVTPGQNQVRIEAVVPWSDGMALYVGADLAVPKWSLLAAPEGFEIRGFGIREATNQDVQGYTRFTTDAIDAGERAELTLIHAGGGEVQAEDLFAKVDEAQDQKQARAEGKKGGSHYLPLIFLAGLLIVILVGALRKRG